MKYIILILALISFNSFAGIDDAPGVVARHLRKKLALSQNAFSSSQFSLLRTHDDEAYYLKRIRLQYVPFAEFELFVLKVKVMPIIEFRWSRKNPQGWVNYKRM